MYICCLTIYPSIMLFHLLNEGRNILACRKLFPPLAGLNDGLNEIRKRRLPSMESELCADLYILSVQWP